jgi:hypothetical protein
MSAPRSTVIPQQRNDAYGDPFIVRCQTGIRGRNCPNEAVVAVIENAKQPHAKRFLCSSHYVVDACDRPSCDKDGREHVTVTGHERPLWLCHRHAIEVARGKNPEANR